MDFANLCFTGKSVPLVTKYLGLSSLLKSANNMFLHCSPFLGSFAHRRSFRKIKNNVFIGLGLGFRFEWLSYIRFA